MKLILSDLDLTLLRSDLTISQTSARTFQKLKEAGHFFGFATSRGVTSLKPYADLLKPDVIICGGGGSIYYKGELIKENTFNVEEIRKLLNKTYQVCGHDVEITVDTRDELYWNRKNNRSSSYMPNAIYDLLDDFKEEAIKFCVQITDAEKAQKIALSVPNCKAIPFSDIPWYKFSPGDSTKEKAAEFIASYLNIPMSEVIAFGDDFSDLEMLRLCGRGIAMENAIEPVKEIADFVTSSNDNDGVSEYIEKYVLNS